MKCEDEGETAPPKKQFEDFEKVLDAVGSRNSSQRRLLCGVMFIIIFLYPFSEHSTIFLLDIPEHYCHVPGKPNNVSVETWKNLTIPWETGPDGVDRYSKCLMHDPEDYNKTMKCAHGWTYHEGQHTKTIPANFDWVCDRDHYVTECFTYGGVGAAIGSIVFGILADKFGRRRVFILAAALNLLIRTISFLFAKDFNVYKILLLLSESSLTPVFHFPVLICVEMSGINYRSKIYSYTWMVWVIGNSCIPIVAYFCSDWWILGCITSFTACVIFIAALFVPESPRWLVTAGHKTAAVKVISKIAKTNGKNLKSEDIEKMVEQLQSKIESDKTRSAGICRILSMERLVKNTVLLTVACSMNELLSLGLTLNATHMAGNPYVNYFVLSIIELPGGWLGGTLSNITGRRWTQAVFFALCTVFCLISAVIVPNAGTGIVVICAVAVIKFGVSITSLIVDLQSTEMFPTQVRSSGTGFVRTMATMLCIVAPYIVYTGSTNAAQPYIILCICSAIGALGSACLPETLNQRLPETMEDADAFGKTQKFWSYKPRGEIEENSEGHEKGDLK